MNVSSYFRSLKEEEDFIDVTLSCEDSQYTAHKVVLSACSPYFRKLLKVRRHSQSFSSLILYRFSFSTYFLGNETIHTNSILLISNN